jgi:hypothetical protein
MLRVADRNVPGDPSVDHPPAAENQVNVPALRRPWAKAITDMEEQGRDAKEVSGHKTDAMVSRVFGRSAR